MKLSDDRINHISHEITENLAKDSRVEFKDTFNRVRLSVRASLGKIMQQEQQLADLAERKVSSLKRNIPRGSSEWDVLYMQYYHEEIDKLRSIH